MMIHVTLCKKAIIVIVMVLVKVIVTVHIGHEANSGLLHFSLSVGSGCHSNHLI